ncbi:MAG: hypothetical protein QW540_09770, partial [Archaeoglobaceae archaeon]
SKAGFARMFADTCIANEKFLMSGSRGAYQEVVELVNDSIDQLVLWVKVWKNKGEKVLSRPVFFYVNNVLLPFSYAIMCDLLIGNIPACYMELRFMLEALAKCYIAEASKSGTFFEIQILSLEKYLSEGKVSLSNVLREFGNMTGLKEKPLRLWKKISDLWAHLGGFVSRVVDHVIETGRPPLYSLILPMEYTDADLPLLNELERDIGTFREILHEALSKYRKELM